MSTVTAESIKQALASVADPDSGRDVVSAGMISGVVARAGKAGYVLTIGAGERERKAALAEACEAAVRAIPGVQSVTAVVTSEVAASGQQPAASDRKAAVWNTAPVEGVKKIIAIASGKGGVGKSTTAVNLALALRRAGKRAGLLDADIYGPSIPRMLGLTGAGQPPIENGKMIPPVVHGIPCMSMGFVTGDQAAILRGPMITRTLHQLLRFTRWATPDAPLDALIADMPPGTGDIHLSMAQQAPLDGAIIVTTPQEVAVIDARKALIMFQKLGVPVLGVVENMSGGIFGSGGGARLADEAGVPFLGKIPLDVAIVEACDHGEAYAGAQDAAYAAIARRI